MEQKKRQTKSVEAKQDELENDYRLTELKVCLEVIQGLSERYTLAIWRIRSSETTVKGMRKGLNSLSEISKEFAELSEKAFELSGHKCAYCGNAAQGNRSIHRDGLGIGPEVDLCDNCGSGSQPSCDQIWDRIAISKERPKKSVQVLKADGKLLKRFSDATSKLDLLMKGLER